MLECGCYPSEIYALTENDINLGQENLMIKGEKTKAARGKIPLVIRYAHPVEEHKIEAIKKPEMFNRRMK